MGAGCYYTNKDGSRAAWIELPDDEFDSLVVLEEVEDLLSSWYCKYGDNDWRTGLHMIKLDHTYYGDGLLIYMWDRYEDSYSYEDLRLSNLARANQNKCYKKLLKRLHDAGFSLRIAAGAWCSAKYIP